MNRHLGQRPELLLSRINPHPAAEFEGAADETAAATARARIVREPRVRRRGHRSGGRLARGLVAATTIAVVAAVGVWAFGALRSEPPTIDLPSGGIPTTTQPGAFALPDLRGRPLAEADRIVRDLGLQPGRITPRIEAGATVGQVLAQTPAAGSTVARGDVVALEVAAPDGIGGSRSAAPDASLPVLRPGGTNSSVTEPSVRLSGLRGQVVVLGFTSSTCSGCARMAGVLQMADVVGLGGGVEAIAVATGDSEQAARGLAQPGSVFALALDRDGSVARSFGVGTLPSAVVLDREGRVAARLDGRVNLKTFQTLLNVLLAEPEPADLRTEGSPVPLPALSGSPLPESEVPAVLLRTASCEVYTDRVWLIGTTPGGARVYLARGPRDGLAQVVVFPTADAGASISCGATAAQFSKELLTKGVAGGVGYGGAGNSSYIALAAPGYTEAVAGRRRARIVDGLFEFRGTAYPGKVTLVR